jgi:hypothetical protein
MDELITARNQLILDRVNDAPSDVEDSLSSKADYNEKLDEINVKIEQVCRQSIVMNNRALLRTTYMLHKLDYKKQVKHHDLHMAKIALD